MYYNDRFYLKNVQIIECNGFLKFGPTVHSSHEIEILHIEFLKTNSNEAFSRHSICDNTKVMKLWIWFKNFSTIRQFFGMKAWSDKHNIIIEDRIKLIEGLKLIIVFKSLSKSFCKNRSKTFRFGSDFADSSENPQQSSAIDKPLSAGELW